MGPTIAILAAAVLASGCGGVATSAGPAGSNTVDIAPSDGMPASVPPTTAIAITTTTVAPTTTTTGPPVVAPLPAPVTPVPAQPVTAGQRGPAVVQLQQRLLEMGYWQPAADGTYGAATQHAVTAFQKVNGLPRSGKADGSTLAAMALAPRPIATKPVAGRSLEVDLNRQILMVINAGQVETVLDISSGKASTPTPPGDYQIQRQIDGMRISDLGQLWRPKYFTGGYALHGSPSVPTKAASHGCVRLTNDEIDWLWASGVAPVGTPLSVY